MIDLYQARYRAFVDAPDKYKLYDHMGFYLGVTEDAPDEVRKAWARIRFDLDVLPHLAGMISENKTTDQEYRSDDLSDRLAKEADRLYKTFIEIYEKQYPNNDGDYMELLTKYFKEHGSKKLIEDFRERGWSA